LELQNVEDDILAFWGISDDYISDDVIRNMIKMGKCIERIDLYARLKMNIRKLRQEFDKLEAILEKSGMSFNRKEYNALCRLTDEDDNVDYVTIVHSIENLLEE
jgi:uncharacterized alpha-E superfamily protein